MITLAITGWFCCCAKVKIMVKYVFSFKLSCHCKKFFTEKFNCRAPKREANKRRTGEVLFNLGVRQGGLVFAESAIIFPIEYLLIL